jgi:hypothetical protein
MEEVPEQPPELPTVAVIDPLRRMLEALVPEAGEQLTFEDVLGNRYTSPSVTSLRVQAQLLQILQRHSGLLQGENVAQQLMAALSSPELLGDLCNAMELLHPKAVKAAVAAIRASSDDETCSTADAFSGEAILGAVLPFFAGPILRILDLVQGTNRRTS